jgi:hypothetical protein
MDFAHDQLVHGRRSYGFTRVDHLSHVSPAFNAAPSLTGGMSLSSLSS